MLNKVPQISCGCKLILVAVSCSHFQPVENVDKITQVYKIAAHCMLLVKPYTVTRLMEREIEKPQMEIH